jgi:hypothetical protein
MSAQPENQHMEGVQDPATDIKGKGKAQEGETVEESMDDFRAHRYNTRRKQLT